MGADPLDFGEAIVARLFEERREGVLVQPVRRLRQGCDYRHLGRRVGGCEVPEHAGSCKTGLAMFGDLHGEQPLVNDLPESVHDPGSVEVDSNRPLVLE